MTAKKCDWQGCKAWARKGSSFCRHHSPNANAKPAEAMSLLEVVVWDALKNSRCPAKHRYQGPGKSLPCRWCRTAHAVILVLIKMEAQKLNPLALIEQLEKQVGWSLADPVVGITSERGDASC